MARFCGVHEIGRRAGRGERCRQLTPDMPAFPHAADDYAPFDAQHQINRLMERRSKRSGLDHIAKIAECPVRHIQRAAYGIERSRGAVLRRG